MKFLFFYIFAINYITFSMFKIDKERAIKHKNRISEKNLLTLCFLGGSIGGWLAMRHLKHKNAKQSFKLKFYAVFIIQVVLFFALFKR
ncbi:DUF1294 domain-containing protein [Myroides sp. WP-1]|uniref:DUF1294 domain-containing protein n=1 Tax=Myroides sp. WP-1 TaxID=2759944 RepID=UPI0015FAAAE8|nr:DUF1294 domain-containing protein [Myroides sp. WP-1]MBB1139426.1 DUF1294 domain-containing protein [Myroides sp. WP-1]